MQSEKTRGIVLHSLKYSDSATIVSIYTRQFGRVSYMVYGANKKKSACRPALLQPLSVLELEVAHQPGREMQRVKEMRAVHSFEEIPFQPVKNALALFLSELLFRVLRQTEPDEELYDFLEFSVLSLDACSNGLADFHLVFLLKLTRYLGCEPNAEQETRGYFDMLNGVFCLQRPLHAHYLLPDVAADLHQLLCVDYGCLAELPRFSRKRRNELLENVLEYYRLHVPDFNGVHSLEVLQSLFD